MHLVHGFLAGPTQVRTLTGIMIGSVIFAPLTIVSNGQTDSLHVVNSVFSLVNVVFCR